MYLKTINIIDFKNIKSSEVIFSNKINCFVGSNGAGKTNLLDAIYYLSLCKSITGVSDRQSVNHDAGFFMLEGEYCTSDSHHKYICSYSPSTGKIVKKDGKTYSKISEHIGAVPIVSITPSDSSLIEESGEARRKYLNTFISQFDKIYLSTLIKYNSIIIQRNQLLKEYISTDKMEVLEIFNIQLSELGTIIYNKRKEIIEKLSPIISSYYNTLSGGAEQVTLQYQSQLEQNSMDELLERALEKDCQSGFTSVGIGRDDIRMKIDDYPIKRFGSQGQQKSFLIAMKLAQYDIIIENRYSEPILLLDDIFDRLDAQRVTNLISIVSDKKFGQIFITDCDGNRVENILKNETKEYKIFNIKDGRSQ